MASIRLEDIHKTYPNGHIAARGLDLEIEDGEFVVLVGPSGCGKSTALRMVAGLETPTRGRVFIGDRDITDHAPQDRDIAMVFQTYALYPHKTVRDNLAFGLRMRGTARSVIDERVTTAAHTLGLEEFLDRKPAQLSGGQRQRVALGRAIVREPKAFLFDEPLSNLDAKLRVQTRAELARMHRQLGATMLYVTHDQEEAMTLGDRVAVMRDGTFQHVAPPMDVYRRPANRFVAGFIGSPAMNFISCALERDADAIRLRSPSFSLPLEEPLAPEPGSDGVQLGIRPQDIEIVPVGGSDMTARVEVVEPLGSALLIHSVDVAEPAGSVVVSPSAAARDVERLELRIVAPPDTVVREDETVGLRLRRDRLHIFDAGTGDRLS